MPFVGGVGSGNAEPVKLAGADAGEPYVPDVTGLVADRVEDDASSRFSILDMSEQIEAHARGMPAENCKVDAIPVHMRTERQGNARANGLDLTQAEQSLEFGELFRP